jgi:hypothetical protein
MASGIPEAMWQRATLSLTVTPIDRFWKYEKKIGALRKKYIMEDRQRLMDTIERFTPTYKAVIKNQGQVSLRTRTASLGVSHENQRRARQQLL